jgi:8-oxo-dGTP pyrophosphatase MutT (NUDIX family)
MSSDSEVFVRNAARVLVIDRDDRVLLIHTQLDPPRPDMIWLTPGGGLNDGESAEDAARRELWEETGLEAGELHAVWDRRHAFRWHGRNHEQRERYFFARFHAPSVEFTALEEHESKQLLALRWWQVEAIQTSDEIFVPQRLGALLPPLLRGELPAEPIKVGA